MKQSAVAPKKSLNKMSAAEKLIVALDVDTAQRALDLFAELHDVAAMFKIGVQLFTAAGPDLVREIVSRGGRVFLDLKYHDIPNTVALTAVEATRLGVSIFNIHSSGGREMMKWTAEAVAETAARENLVAPKVLGVTLLTSIDQENLGKLGIEEPVQSVVRRLAMLAKESGLDGVVASAQEIKTIREAVGKEGFLIVTPGIRAASDAAHDQRRTMSAAEAIRAGADYVVVGRPIVGATNRRNAAQQIAQEIELALAPVGTNAASKR